MAQTILVLGELVRGELSRGGREALALGRALAEPLSAELAAFLFSGDEAIGREAIAYGADLAYLPEAPLAAEYQPETWADVAEQVCRAVSAQIVLLPHTPFGSDLAPRLSLRLGAPWAAGCLEVRASGDELVLSRPFVGGKVLLEEAAGFPLIATLRAMVAEPLDRDPARPGEVRRLVLAPHVASGRLRHVAHVASDGGVAEELAGASMVVSGGLGMGSNEGFARLAELATQLGASLGASKAAVDRGLAESERQVGLTGVAVAPRLYLAVGISGSAQHMAGCGKSRNIVAINKDPEANIFKFCRYGLVMEWERALPLLLAKLRDP